MRDGSASSAGSDALLRAMPAVFVLIWSTGFIVARYGMPVAPPFGFLAWRFGLSALVFGVWVLLVQRSAQPLAWPRSPVHWGHLAVLGLLMQLGYLGGVWSAVRLGLGAGAAALIVGLQPVLTAVWLSSRGGQVSRLQWLGLLLGVLGLVLVLWQKFGAGETTPLNLACALAALLAITAGTLYQKRFVPSTDVRVASLLQFVVAALACLPLAWVESAWFGQAIVYGAQFWASMAWSVLALSLGASSLLYLLIQRGAATTVSATMYLVPPATAAIAWLLFDEPLGPTVLAGVALTAVGVALVVRQEGKPA